MSRTVYALSDETRSVLSQNPTAIAKEWDKNPSYIYQILSDVETDRFAQFKPEYAAAVRAGVDVSPWDTALSEIKARYTRECSTDIECLTLKITRDADCTAKLVEALKDGQIDDRESRAIRRAIQKQRDSLDVLEAMVTVPLAMPAEVTKFKAGGGR